MKIIKNIFPIFIVLILSFFSIKPLLMSGFFPIHDDTQVARVYEMGKALSDGMFPVRWVSDLGYGYGYPIFNFYAPLAYYVGGFFNVLGFDALVSTKIMMIVGIILSGVFMYLLTKELWGEIGGLVSSLFYVYAPYHAVDIYVRGDVAEFWAYAFIPLAFYGMLKAFQEKKWKYIVVGAFGFSGVILSHNLTAMMITPFLIFLLFFLILSDTKEKIGSTFYFLITLFFGISISAFYWFPALVEMKFTNVLSQIGGGADFKNHFVCAVQLWQSPWGFGGSAAGCIDGMSLKIGKLHVIVSLVAIVLLIISLRYRKFKNLFSKSDQQIIFAIFSVLAFVISVLLTLEISKPIWEFIPAMAFFQFPWRFLLIISFFTSILAGFSIWIIQKAGKDIIKLDKANFIIVSIAIFTLIFFNSKLFVPQDYLYKKSSDYTNSLSLKWTASRISDEYMPKNFIKPSIKDDTVKNQIVAQDKSTKVLFQSSSTNKIHANVSSGKKKKIKVSIAYFPGWNVFIDNKKSMPEVTNKGFFVNIPSGEHALDIFFAQTPIEKFATSISLASVFLLIAGIILSRKRLFHE
ncbi:MAG: hypothetical protein A2860_03970 [Candidatus Levybacteria bacterium RIFCSPHIGHO2_01_FULL_37_33]|nr:MAG: hypothetical protein A2860_03970 [Candidatus Levybacteria bacterium RIFCSPHIGHO2_01_FULL_37_33]OGH33051.1 MAG: hypothetical protein A2953_00065 [Candidatus Levybacteria bacterium RIFCSPLOWO2_01_FULL_36_54]